MEYFIYILYSENSNLYYVGYTNDFERRVKQHNHSENLTFTSKHRPWQLKAVFYCGKNEAEAIKTERFIKRQKSRNFLEHVINNKTLTGILAQLVRVPHVQD